MSCRAPGMAGEVHNSSERSGDDLDVHAVMVDLSGVVLPVCAALGHPDPVGGDDGAVQHQVSLGSGDREGLVEGGGHPRQDGARLADVPEYRRHPDLEPGGQGAVRGVVVQIGQHEQGLIAGAEAAPDHPRGGAVAPQRLGQQVQGGGGHGQTNGVDKHGGAPGRGD